jgi:hypothetical protein
MLVLLSVYRPHSPCIALTRRARKPGVAGAKASDQAIMTGASVAGENRFFQVQLQLHAPQHLVVDASSVS